MNPQYDQRVVMTLDAGGTNFVFSAIQANEEIVDPITLPSNGHQLDWCLQTIVDGFKQVESKLDISPAAISFAFPGPADYPRGIIGDLANLPAFRGGVALGPMLEEVFEIPVFINNDGDLFVYGEAIAGFLPHINDILDVKRSAKHYQNLFGVTLGTGFGGGIVRKGELFIGDNSAAGEIWVMRNKVYPGCFAEEGASIRGVKKAFAKRAGIEFENAPEPKEIYDIATGTVDGNVEAAKGSFEELGQVVGDALANASTLIDGLVVIGGGVAGAHSMFLPEIVKEMNGTINTYDGEPVDRMELKAYNLEDEKELEEFIKGDARKIKVPGYDKEIIYDPMKRIGVGISKLGTSRAVAIGAYAFALHALDNL